MKSRLVFGTAGAALAVTVLTVLTVSPAYAANGNRSYPVYPGVYNPTHRGVVRAAWVRGIGERVRGHQNYGLLLQNAAPSGAAAYADLGGVLGTRWENQLGFDLAPGTACTADQPRFDVLDASGTDHFFGCVNGTQTRLANGWTRVRFTGSQAETPIARNTSITSITVVEDQRGTAVLDDIYYNGQTTSSPS